MKRAFLLSLAVSIGCPNVVLADPVPIDVYVSCNLLMDPAGDVSLEAPGAGRKVDDEHVDVQSVDVIASRNGFRVMVYDTALDARRRGTWTVTFVAKSVTGTTTYGARASLGAWTDLPAAPVFTAGVVGRMVTVTGEVEIEENTVTISVPYRALGKAGRKGTRLSGFAVTAEEAFVRLPTGPADAPRVQLHDAGTSKRTWPIGHSCGTTKTPPWGPPPRQPTRSP